MSKFAMTAALALITAAIAPVAYAQNSARPTNVALTTQAGQLRASQLIGSTVYDVQNRNIGSVNDVISRPRRPGRRGRPRCRRVSRSRRQVCRRAASRAL
jgi:hypothetical protein